MPKIPAFQGSNQLPNLPGPVLDRERRPTVDNRAQSQAVGNLAKSTKMPDVPMSLAENSLGAVGAAIAKAGNMLGAIAEVDRQNQDKITVSKADTRMSIAREELENFRATNPDPDKWLEGHDSIAKKAKEEIFALKMSPTAQAEVAARWDRWYGISGKQVAGAAIGERARMAAKVNQDGASLAIQSQDMDRLEVENSDAEKNLRWTPERSALNRELFREEGQRQKNQLESETLKAAENETLAIARVAGPDAAFDRIEKMPLDERGKERMRSEARQAAAQASGDIMDDVLESIESGDIKDPAGLRAVVGENNPHVGPALLKKVDTYLAQRNVLAQQQDKATNGHKNAVRLMNDAQLYDPKTDPTSERYLAMKLEVEATVPEALQADVNGILRNKRDGTPTPMPTPMKQFVRGKMDLIFDPVTGPDAYRWAKKAKVDPQGNVVKDDARGEWKTVETDAKKRELAEREQATILQAMDEWANANPEKAKDVKEVEKKLIEVIPEGTTQSALEAMKGAPTAPVPTAALNDDLLNAVKEMESFIPKAYDDYKQHSVGYGTKARHPGEILTKEQADARLREELAGHATRVDAAAAENGVKLTPGQRNALISFDFNTGKGAFVIEASNGDVDDIKRRIGLYNKVTVNGRKVPLEGLTNRRKKELAIYES